LEKTCKDLIPGNGSKRKIENKLNIENEKK